MTFLGVIMTFERVIVSFMMVIVSFTKVIVTFTKLPTYQPPPPLVCYTIKIHIYTRYQKGLG